MSTQAPVRTLSLLCAASLLSIGCGRDEPAVTEATAPISQDILPIAADEPAMAASRPVMDQIPAAAANAQSAIAEVFGGQIPYPEYPNGSRYRVGGENGLNIVVYQTSDSFVEVDGYYTDVANKGGMERLPGKGMTDYVRYSVDDTDMDPFGTHRPGIVIHQFLTDADRQAVGASPEAKTNIIMSFRAE